MRRQITVDNLDWLKNKITVAMKIESCGTIFNDDIIKRKRTTASWMLNIDPRSSGQAINADLVNGAA